MDFLRRDEVDAIKRRQSVLDWRVAYKEARRMSSARQNTMSTNSLFPLRLFYPSANHPFQMPNRSLIRSLPSPGMRNIEIKSHVLPAVLSHSRTHSVKVRWDNTGVLYWSIPVYPYRKLFVRGLKSNNWYVKMIIKRIEARTGQISMVFGEGPARTKRAR